MIVAAVVLLVSGAMRARAASAPGASAVRSLVGNDAAGRIAARASTTDNQFTSSGSSSSGAVRYANGTATVSSFLVGRGLVSEADVSLSDVSLLDGQVKADSVSLVATASAGSASADSGTGGSFVVGLTVNGESVDPDARTLPVPGAGTLTILDGSVDASGPSPSAAVTGLRLVLDQQVGDLAAGTVIVVGAATASADSATVADLLKQARAASSPTPLPAPLPTPKTPRPKPSHRAGRSSGGGGRHGGGGNGGGGNGGGGNGGGGNAGSVSSGGAMPPPAPPLRVILEQFPGAAFPVKGPVDYSDTFGAYRADLKGHHHQGTDIFARMGTPIVAVMAGVVDYSTTGIGGNNAHLYNRLGDYFYYAHMSRFAAGLKSGDSVRQGQVIGYVGETGDAAGTSPHLHFEIHPDGGAAVDPFPYLEAWRAAAAGIPPAAAAPAHDAQLAEVGSRIPLGTVLARRGYIAGLDLTPAVVIDEPGGQVVRHDELPPLAATDAILMVTCMAGAAAFNRMRRPELAEVLGEDEMVVRVVVRREG